MDARDSTTANADLWNVYLRAQWRAWLDPFGLGRSSDEIARILAEAAAAGIATAVSIFMAPSISRLYADNAPAVTRFVAESGSPALPIPEHIAIPSDYARRPTGDSQSEAWPQPVHSSTSAPEHTVLAY